MYRQGLGDCFLITLPLIKPQADRANFYIMIDCGVILGTANAADEMIQVVEDLIRQTDGRIDLLLATHAHWDHISGFTQAADALQNLKFGQVWMPWTEDPKDPSGRRLQDDRATALRTLQMGLAEMRIAADATDDDIAELAGLLDFFGMGKATSEAVEAVRRLNPNNVRYCRPTDKAIHHEPTGVRLYVLGPPLDEKFLKRTNPSKSHPETYSFAFDLLAASSPWPRPDQQATDSPFGTLFAIPLAAAKATEFFQKYYWTTDGSEDWRSIDMASFANALELALQLDKVTNNTSLVLAIELENGDVLLFPADAQVGSWMSWSSLEWKIGTNEISGQELLKRSGQELLKRTIFYKVGHHGSHNATLRAEGLELMDGLQVAMIPVDENMAKKKGWRHMPLEGLVAALKESIVIRSDKPAPASKTIVIDPNGLFYEVSL